MAKKDLTPYRSKRINPYLQPSKPIGTGTPPRGNLDIPRIDDPLLQLPGGGGGGVSKTVLEESEQRRKRINPHLPEEQGPIALPPATVEPETKTPAPEPGRELQHELRPDVKVEPTIPEKATEFEEVRGPQSMQTMFETHSGVKKEPAPIGEVGQMFPDGTFKVLPGDQGLDTRGDWAEPLRSLFDPRDRSGRRLLVIACCATKTDDPGEIPALERYAGTLFQTLKSKGIPDDVDVAILSAEHGLIQTDYPLSEYDTEMTPDRKQELLQDPKFTQLVKGTLGGLGGNDYKDVLIAGGKNYRDTIIEAHNSGVRKWKPSKKGKDIEYGKKGDWIPVTDRPYWITETKGRGIGDQRQQLGEWLQKSYYDPSEEGVVIETPKSLEPPTVETPKSLEPPTVSQAQWNQEFMEEIRADRPPEKPALTPVELRSQINKKTATKLGSGLYNYRGFEIERLGTEEGAEYVRWNILAPEIPGAPQDFVLDPENTFGDAKQVIDKWLASPEKYNSDYIFKFTDITKKATGGFIDKPLYERTL